MATIFQLAHFSYTQHYLAALWGQEFSGHNSPFSVGLPYKIEQRF